MTPEEIAQQKQRFMAISDEEMRKIIIFLSNWITKYLKGYGYGEPDGLLLNIDLNITEICSYCLEAIWEGRWRWHKNWKLSTELIQVATSRISHIIWGNSRIRYIEPFKLDMIKAENQMNTEFYMREEGFKIAEQTIGDNPLFKLYLEALKGGSNCHLLIAEKMNMTVKEVEKVEQKLLNFLAEKLHGRSAEKS